MTGLPSIPTQVSFNIPELFKDAFGLYVRFPIYILGKAMPGVPPEVKMEDWNMNPFYAGDPSFQDKYRGFEKPNGTLIWDQFCIRHRDFNSLDNEPEYYLPLVTTVEISQPKNVVKTDLIGNDGKIKGTAKELMSEGDTIITFRGLCINYSQPKQYPEQDVRDLNKLFQLNESLPVVSKILAAHDIYNLVFINKEFPPMEGYANVQPFELTALSDNPIILEVQ
jgi:hypothetical protein